MMAVKDPLRLKKAPLRKRIASHWELYLFLIPAVIWYGIFRYGPLYGMQIAFRNFNGALGIWGSKWVGLKHFRTFFESYYFWPLLRNTLALSFYHLLASFPLPILLALMLNEMRVEKYRKVVQTVAYAPHFISLVVLVGTVKIIFGTSTGLASVLVGKLGISYSNILTDPNAFRHVYVWSGIWQNVGWSAIIYLASLSAIDPQQHEAAIIDGASRLQRIWHINLPVIVPVITIMLILNSGSIMNIGFEKVLLLQNDLIMDTADVISTYVYRRGLLHAEFSFSSAVDLFNNVCNFLLLIVVNYISGRLNNNSLF